MHIFITSGLESLLAFFFLGAFESKNWEDSLPIFLRSQGSRSIHGEVQATCWGTENYQRLGVVAPGGEKWPPKQK